MNKNFSFERSYPSIDSPSTKALEHKMYVRLIGFVLIIALKINKIKESWTAVVLSFNSMKLYREYQFSFSLLNAQYDSIFLVFSYNIEYFNTNAEAWVFSLYKPQGYT